MPVRGNPEPNVNQHCLAHQYIFTANGCEHERSKCSDCDDGSSSPPNVSDGVCVVWIGLR
jgi:hypothetical protein